MVGHSGSYRSVKGPALLQMLHRTFGRNFRNSTPLLLKLDAEHEHEHRRYKNHNYRQDRYNGNIKQERAGAPQQQNSTKDQYRGSHISSIAQSPRTRYTINTTRRIVPTSPYPSI